MDPIRRLRRRLLGTITSVATAEPVVALTFDDGPHPDTTPRLLDILEHHGARATFFMVGEAARRLPELVRRAAASGNALGLHSWDHPSFPLISGRERREQIRTCALALAPYASPIFRPPYGHQSLASRLDAGWLGYQVITWDVVAQDWEPHDADWFADRLSRQLRPGCIIACHDWLYHAIEPQNTDRRALLEAVDRLLDRWSGRYRFVTVPKLLQLGKPQRVYWARQGDIAWLNSLQGAFSAPRKYAPAGRGTHP
jgi:peptidoglycan/xylan/chitin deacetylase (PgdA/CDA1 family)